MVPDMTLPEGYTSKQYLEEAFDFLSHYQWIFNSPNTHILSNRTLDSIPSEWVQYFGTLNCDNVHSVAARIPKSNTPASLKDFLDTIDRLCPKLPEEGERSQYKIPPNAKLSRKKIHEILTLGPVINRVAKEYSCDYILDVGTGLGYLPRLLTDVYGYKVLGVECSAEKIKTAMLNPRETVRYIEHFICEESGAVLEQSLDTLEAKKVCITGLHACADLSVTILKLFCELPKARSLVIMPCCYHRLKQNESPCRKFQAGFVNFPASGAFKEMGGDFFTVPFLRLACQNFSFVGMDQEEHEAHARGCLYRTILQQVADEEHVEVKRLKRKSGKKSSFEDYLREIGHSHALSGGVTNITDQKFVEKMREKWNVHKGHIGLVEGLTALQYALQELCENIVLLDRVTMMQERGLECHIVRVTDRKISPRCHAVIALKPTVL